MAVGPTATATAVLVDDHLLLSVLLDDEPSDLRRPETRLFTTGLWYHRACRALGTSGVVGPLSRLLGAPGDATLGAAAIRAVIALPEAVGLVSLRDLGWPMARLLDAGHRLNLLSLEALAAAEHLATRHAGVELCLAEADHNPPLLAAAAARRVPTRLIAA